jgi:hypothetical protein
MISCAARTMTSVQETEIAGFTTAGPPLAEPIASAVHPKLEVESSANARWHCAEYAGQRARGDGVSASIT